MSCNCGITPTTPNCTFVTPTVSDKGIDKPKPVSITGAAYVVTHIYNVDYNPDSVDRDIDPKFTLRD